MMTRELLQHDYTSKTPASVSVPGTIQLRQAGVGNQKNITAAMPISRPNSSPSPDGGAPFYSAGSYTYRPNQLQRGGAMALTPQAPHLEMDPSDQGTWQRPYRFS